MRNTIRHLITTIKPFDDLEARHIADALAWIDSGLEIFRLEKPATPPKHLVSYFVLIDQAKKKILLMDHIKAGLWLPSGGHVEKDEDPQATVRREIKEELNLEAEFIYDQPFFISQATTVNIHAGHTDVSLWYLLASDSDKTIVFDAQEFNSYKWFGYQEILETQSSDFDPHMHRFANKLLAFHLKKD